MPSLAQLFVPMIVTAQVAPIAVFGSDNLRRTHITEIETAAVRTGNVRHTANLTAARCRQVLRCGMKMSQPRTLLVVIVALLLLMCPGFASAQEVPCDNREAASAIPTGDNGQPATSQQIEENFAPTIEFAGITRCLLSDRPLVNHVINYRDYVQALRNPRISEVQEFVIEGSVLWSPRRKTVDLSHLGEEGSVGHSIRWTGVVLGPRVSGRKTAFHGNIDLRGATLHGEANFIGAEFAGVKFDGATFNGIARFYSGTNFHGPASFRDVQFRGEAFFHNETAFHDRASFAGATFDGNAYDYNEARGEAFFHAGTTFLDDVDFGGAIFNVKPHFSADTFKRGVSFKDAVFNVEARFGMIAFPGPTSFQNAAFNQQAIFEDAQFRQDVDFDGVQFAAGAKVSFAGSIFDAEVTFEDAQFRQDVDFDGVQFAAGAKVSFAGSIFDAEVTFEEITFPGPTWFHEAQFNMGAIFSNATFNHNALFDRAHFHQPAAFDGVQFAAGAKVSFAGSIFDAVAAFGRITFPGPASFQDAQFNTRALFQNAVFNRQAIFDGAQFRQHVEFDGVQFAKEDMVSFPGSHFDPEAALERAKVSFAGSIFDVEAAFGGVTFPGPASFRKAVFKKGASFQKAVFQQKANFEGASFAGYLSFRDAEIQGTFRLVDTTWESRADFRKSIIAELDWNSDDRPTTVKGVFDAREAQFKSLTIKDVYFSDLADFSDATFGNATSATGDKILFEDVIFERAADFLRADFQADAIFVDNRFRGLLDITNATFAERARLCLFDNRIGQLLMDRGHLSTTQAWQLFRKLSADPLLESRFRAVNVKISDKTAAASEAGAASEAAKTYSCAEPKQADNGHEHLQKIYRSIESSFRNAKDRWGENEAWYLGTVASRKAGGWFWDIVLGFFLDFPSRYGIDYIRALAVSVGWVLLFWPVYWFYFRWVYLKKHRELPVINLAAPPEQRRALRFRPFERLFHPTVRETRSVRPWQDALFLSCRAFFKLGLGSSYPPVLAYLVYVEWVVGMYMLIHFLFVLKNTLPIALPFLSG